MAEIRTKPGHGSAATASSRGFDRRLTFAPELAAVGIVRRCRRARTEVLVSSATAWEIATKHRLGKLEHAADVVRGYSDHLRTALVTELPISSAHALLAGGFKNAHEDPFDRLLASQSTLEGIPLVSNDRAFDEFPVTLFW